MKKLLFIAIAAVIAVGFAACSDNDDDDRFIALSQLPGNAQSFISAYFGGADVFKVTTENKSSGTEYKVTFRNGYEVEFDATGSWTDVDAPSGRTVPVGIAPAAIQTMSTPISPPTASTRFHATTEATRWNCFRASTSPSTPTDSSWR
ncbi:MAG: PepSY-like domain-containing protein [Muribaculaceae bacterium]|nr:PepSY-like domain-containing protein [Muribaculaceae bacterium]